MSIGGRNIACNWKQIAGVKLRFFALCVTILNPALHQQFVKID
jgi:hypothetical protein